ncbi:hypothetical protein MY11210_008189 [Beauveria gryllotalpidicola]
MARCTLLDVPPELRVMICQYLEFRDLFHLTRSHRNIYEFAVDAMFRQDALTRNSSAILWAASASGVSLEYGNMAVAILHRSIKHGGEVNARHYRKDAVSTALHVAVAHGNKQFVQELIYYGAKIKSFSLRLWEFLNVGRFNKKLDSCTRLKDFAKKARIQDQCWFPLLPAMFRHDFQVAELVLGYHKSCYLAIESKYLYVPPLRKSPNISAAYTILHLLAEENVFPDLHETLFDRFRADAAFPGPVSRKSPLMKAIKKGNEAATKILISLPQNLNVVSNLGWPALSYAVEGAATHFMPKARDWSVSVVKLLVEKGANANMGRPSSPLQLAVTSLLQDKIEVDPRHGKRMRQVIEVLLDYGADVNVAMASGGSLSHYMFLELEADSKRHSFRKLFAQFLGYGMRVNDLFPDGTSFLGKSLASQIIGDKITAGLLDHGARPTPQESDGILHRWLRKDKNLSKTLESQLPLLAPMFSQPAVDQAFFQTITKHDVKRFMALLDSRKPSNPSLMLGEALQNRFARRQDLYVLPFDPNWTNSNGQGYSHIVIEELGDGRYSEREALVEMHRLIANGVKLGQRDLEGMTVLQRLRQVQKLSEDEDPFAKLERLLTRSRLQEQGNEF